MSVFKLVDDHPLTKAGLRYVRLVETERGLRPGEVVFEFPLGRVIDTGMACRRDGIIPADIDLLTIHKEAIALRATCNELCHQGEGPNILRFRRAG